MATERQPSASDVRMAYLRGHATLEAVKAAEEAEDAASFPPLPPTDDLLDDVYGCICRLGGAHEHYGAGIVGPRYVRQRSAEFGHEWARLTAAFAAAKAALLRYERGDDGGTVAREWLTTYAGLRQRSDGAWEQKGDGDGGND